VAGAIVARCASGAFGLVERGDSLLHSLFLPAAAVRAAPTLQVPRAARLVGRG
jgi:hypothetical protein